MSTGPSNIDKITYRRIDFLPENSLSSVDLNQCSNPIDLQELKSLIGLIFCCHKALSFKKQAEFKKILCKRDLEAQKLIDNFHQVDETYYRGSAPNAHGIEYLIENIRIKTIIDLRYIRKKDRERQEAIVKEAGLNYVNIPMLAFLPPGFKQINQFLNIINNANNQPVYVHCLQGKDRTGIMTAIYRINKYNYNYEKAFAEMLKFGHHAGVFPLMRMWLYEFSNKYKIQPGN